MWEPAEDRLTESVARIAERGLVPARRETYSNGVRKVAYRDPDGNEFGSMVPKCRRWP
jgi:hypothetical protein